MNYIRYEQRGMVGVVTIDRPKALNALNSGVLAELAEVFAAIPQQEVRCVVLTGAGDKAFAAGADVEEMSALNKSQGERFGQKGNEVLLMIENFPLPVIAAVNGFALGGGCELALACDIRLASENAVFGQPETSLGIIPGFGGTQRLARIIGMGHAKEMLFTGKRIKAAEALERNLVNAVYPRERLMEEALHMAAQIAANEPIAVRATKKVVNEGSQVEIAKALALEARMFGSCFESADRHNAMSAFLGKRAAEPFINR